MTDLNLGRVSVDELSVARMNGAPGGLSGAVADILQAIKINTGPGGTLASTINANIFQVVNGIRALQEDVRRIIPPSGAGGGLGGIAIPAEEERLKDLLSKVEETLLAFSENVDAQGKVIGQGLYSNALKLKEYGFLSRSITTSIDNFFGVEQSKNRSLMDMIRANQSASAKNFVRSIGDTILHLTSLGSAFTSAKRTFTAEGGTFMKDVFGTNILSPGEFFLNGWSLLSKGLFGSTDNLITTLGLVRKALDSDMMSPLVMTGQSLTEYAGSLHKLRADIYKLPDGENIRRFGIQTGDINKIAQDTLDTLHRQGIHAQITDSIVEEYTLQQIKSLQDISAHTGMALTLLEELNKKYQNENSRLEAFGRMTPLQSRNFSAYETDVTAKYGKENSAQLLKLQYEMAKANNDVGTFRSMEGNQAWNNPLLDRIVEGIAQANKIAMSGNTAGAETVIKEISPQLEHLDRISPPSFGRIFQGVGGIDGQLGAIRGLLYMMSTGQTPTPAQNAVAKGSDINESISKLQDLWTNTISPLFTGFAGSAAHMVFAMGALAATMTANMLFMSRMGGGGIIGGAASMVGGVARGVGRLIPGVAAAGLAYETGGGISGAAGAGIGTIVGGAIGTALDGFVGPLGTYIGMAAGGFIGDKIGQYIGGSTKAEAATISPPVSNPVGPSPNIPELGQQTSIWQDNTVSLLTQILNQIDNNNGISSQLLNETVRQTGYMIRGTGTSGPPLTIPNVGTGLSGGSGLPSKSSRPDMSYAQGGGAS